MVDLVRSIRHALGLDRPAAPPVTDESVRRAVEERLLRQTARVRALDYQIEVQRAADRR